MRNLKRSEIVSLTFLIIICGCSTPGSFKLKQSLSGGAYELRTSSDRVVTECERVEKDDGTVLYALSAQVLDDKKRVISLTHFLLLGEKDCNKYRERVAKILKNGKEIYLAGRGDLTDIDKTTEFKHDFPGHGVFKGSDTVLDFFAIANENGDCFSPLNEPYKRCLSYPFPLK